MVIIFVYILSSIMGIDAGFDLYPSLNEQEINTWHKFLNEIRSKYSTDPAFVETDVHIKFAVGEHPALDLNGMNFRRFSSKISGTCGKAERYIREVCEIAKKFFPKRIREWNELGLGCDLEDYSGCTGFYDWPEVHKPTNKYVKK